MDGYELPSPLFSFDGVNNNNLSNVGLMPKIDIPVTKVKNDLSLDGLGIDIKGFGTLASLVGGFMAQRDRNQYRKDLLKREDARIARARKRQDAFEADMKKAWE